MDTFAVLLAVMLACAPVWASRLPKDPALLMQKSATISSSDDYSVESVVTATRHFDDKGLLLPRHDVDDKDFCTTKAFRRRTLKLVREAPFVGLMHDLMNQTRFEASDLVMLHNSFYVVFDNIRHIARIDEKLGDFDDATLSALIPEHEGDPDEESQFEGISFIQTRNTFLVLRESIVHPVHGMLNPQLEEIRMSTNAKKDFTSVNKCVIDFELEDDNKGFEGLHYFQGPDKEDMALGLCESNYCKTIRGDDPPGLDPGHGRLVLTRFFEAGNSSGNPTDCVWKVDKVIEIPSSAYFTDYSGFGFGIAEDGIADVAIASQEDSAIWIGRWDWKTLDFTEDEGRIWHLPRDNDCQKLYCNVEGVAFIDKMRLALVSDRCKGIQSYTCHDKDQAIHVFALAS